MDLNLNDRKSQLLWTETSQTPILKTFGYNNKGTMEVKDFQKFFKKETLQ